MPYPIFSAFGKHANQPYRLLVGNLIEHLLPQPPVRVCAPTSTEATVMRQGRRTIVHLLQYCPERRGESLDLIEDVVPLHNVALSVRREKAPLRVYLAPQQTALEFGYRDGRVQTLVPEVAGHAMIVFE